MKIQMQKSIDSVSHSNVRPKVSIFELNAQWNTSSLQLGSFMSSDIGVFFEESFKR